MNTRQDADLKKYAMSGMAAYLPGMVYMCELMQRQLDEFRAQLAGMQVAANGHTGTGRGSSWARLTAEERSAEMKRRMAKREYPKKEEAPTVRKVVGTPPGKGRSFSWVNKTHPDHAKYVAKMQRMRTRAWARMTKAQREEWKAKMIAGKLAKRQAA